VTPPAARPEPIPTEPPSRLEPAETVAEPNAAGYVIHLSSYKLEIEAAAEAAELVRQGVAARTLRVDVPDRGTWYRIVTGDFASFAQAESAALALQARGVIPYVHIAGNGGRGTPIPVGALDRIRP
jgi:cell division septation protein DedD